MCYFTVELFAVYLVDTAVYLVYADAMRIVQDQSSNHFHIGIERDGQWYAACNRRFKVFVLPEDGKYAAKPDWISCTRCAAKVSAA